LSAAPAGEGRHVSPYLLLALATLFWAGNIILGRAMRADIPPVAMAFWRWTIAFCVVMPFAFGRLKQHRHVLLRSWRLLAFMGGIGIATYNTLSYIALRSTTATNATLFNSLIPVLIVPIAWLVLRERIRPLQALGVAISLAGVLVIVARGDLSTLRDLSINGGDLLLLAAMVLWAFYTVALRFKPPELDTLAFLAAIVLFGLPVLAVFYAMELASGATFELTPVSAVTLAYYGTMPSVVAYLFFNRGVAMIGPQRAGIFIHLVPAYGVILSTLFLNEPPQAFHAAGIVLIFIGIWFTTSARFARPAGADV
jgi:drug/metabolite transporter (DMT)-like permease